MCEPFLIVGLIACIRRVLVITLGMSRLNQPEKWAPARMPLFQSNMIELGMLAGLGVVLKSLWEVEDDLRSGALVEVFADLIQEQTEIPACHPIRSMLTKGVRALVEFLAAELRAVVTV